jgi:hypothetical protein
MPNRLIVAPVETPPVDGLFIFDDQLKAIAAGAWCLACGQNAEPWPAATVITELKFRDPG